MGPTINSIVITTDKMEKVKKFYTALGLIFHTEQHAEELPLHYSATLDDGKVIEIYPRNRETAKPIPTSFDGLLILDVDDHRQIHDNLDSEYAYNIFSDPHILDGRWYTKLHDPDGRLIMLVERKK